MAGSTIRKMAGFVSEVNKLLSRSLYRININQKTSSSTAALIANGEVALQFPVGGALPATVFAGRSLSSSTPTPPVPVPATPQPTMPVRNR